MYKELDVEEFFSEVCDLLADHMEELADYQHLLSYNVTAYKAIQELGMWRNCVSYVGDKPVGYISIVVAPHLHYKESLFAQLDLVWVAHEYRGRGVGKELLQRGEQMAKESGAVVYSIPSKINSVELHGVLKNAAYTLKEVMYSKEI